VPNVDDHGLEVLKKAARNIGAQPKQDYALQTILISDESTASPPSTPVILNQLIPLANVENEIVLPLGTKSFLLKARKICRLKLAYAQGETSVAWIEIPLGGFWKEVHPLASNKIYLQSDRDNQVIEILTY